MGPNKRLVFGVGSKITLEAFITGLRDGGQFLQEGQPKQKIGSFNRPIFLRTPSLEPPPFLATLEKTTGKSASLISFAFWLSDTASCSFSHAHCNHHLQHSLFPPQETPVTSWPEVSNDQLVCQAKKGERVMLTKEQRQKAEGSSWRP